MVSILLDNAVRYTGENGSIALQMYQKRKTVIEVYNTCAAMEQAQLERLFDGFYRPDQSRSKQTGGTGIGLSIAKATAESHGGTIRAESRPEGIAFVVTL